MIGARSKGNPMQCLGCGSALFRSSWRHSGIYAGISPGRTRKSSLKCTNVPWYTDSRMTNHSQFIIQRVQTGVRMEKRVLKVLKAFAEYKDMTLGDLLEGIVLHAFDGKTPFGPDSLRRIAELKKFYGLDLDSSASHRLKEGSAKAAQKKSPKPKKGNS